MATAGDVAADVGKLLDTIQTAVDATLSSATPLLTKLKETDESLDMSQGLSLLLTRPHLLLSSIHNLVILLALRLTSPDSHQLAPQISSALVDAFSLEPTERSLDDAEKVQDELAGELVRCQEIMDKVRGLESKLDYQIKKLVGLADAEEARGKAIIEDVEEDPLSFRPNIGAIAGASAEPKKAKKTYNEEDEEQSGVYRPPRVAAVPYNEVPGPSRRERERRAPALLSEFAATMDGAPVLETTAGLSTRPVLSGLGGATNSVSAKRAAELQRINEFEEENMTRLVTTKREAKRRREDEEALALGYGVAGPQRRRRQNGLEAELEGVLGSQGRGSGSKGVWERVSDGLGRDRLVDRGQKRAGAEKKGKAGKARFEKDVKRRRD